jgi:hypothetical protein
MFDLEREIEQWCRTIIDCGCARETDLNELKDHLHCLVEEHREQGHTEQDAFVEAIKQMGDTRLITDEYARNRTLLQKIAAYDRKVQRSITRRFSAKQLIWFLLGFSMFCALLMLLLAAYGGLAVFWIMLIWFIPFIITVADPRVRRAERVFLKRLFHANETGSPLS